VLFQTGHPSATTSANGPGRKSDADVGGGGPGAVLGGGRTSLYGCLPTKAKRDPESAGRRGLKAVRRRESRAPSRSHATVAEGAAESWCSTRRLGARQPYEHETRKGAGSGLRANRTFGLVIAPPGFSTSSPPTSFTVLDPGKDREARHTMRSFWLRADFMPVGGNRPARGRGGPRRGKTGQRLARG